MTTPSKQRSNRPQRPIRKLFLIVTVLVIVISRTNLFASSILVGCKAAVQLERWKICVLRKMNVVCGLFNAGV